MAIHWSGAGPDSFVSKPLAIFGVFGLGVGTIVYTRYAPDSLTNTAGGRTLTILFLGVSFAWIEGIIIVWNLGYRFNVLLAVLPILVLAGMLVAYPWLRMRLR